jgi:NAD(P)-dependent dehydrogenase (short-subunit alcohol dehydrogenase family)
MTASVKVALVTGASQGIGLAAARRLLADRWTVFFAARNLEKLNIAVEASQINGGEAIAVQCDVSDPRNVDAMFRSVVERFGRLDLVFNNAGTNIGAREVGDIAFDDWRKVISVNLDGAFAVASCAFRCMKAQSPQGGRIINNGSISAHTPRLGSAAYTASKHAISGLTKSIALDGRQYNIACGQIDIGNTASEMTEGLQSGAPQADGSIKPEPVMHVENVVNGVAYMASLPLEANVLTMTVMATTMPYVGRG